MLILPCWEDDNPDSKSIWKKRDDGSMVDQFGGGEDAFRVFRL